MVAIETFNPKFNRAVQALKQAVYDMLIAKPEAAEKFFPYKIVGTQEYDQAKAGIIGFDINRSSDDKLIGRFVAYLHTFGDATPQEVAEAMLRMGVE